MKIRIWLLATALSAVLLYLTLDGVSRLIAAIYHVRKPLHAVPLVTGRAK